MTNFEKIMVLAFSILAVIVLFIGALVFRQQKTINAFAKNTATASNQAAVQVPVKKSPSLAEATKQFPGTIESILGNQLTISVKLTDFSKPKDPEKFKNSQEPMNFTPDDFEIISKSMTVNTDGKTIFDKKILVDLKVGDKVYINSDKSPYTSDTVTAEKIITQ